MRHDCAFERGCFDDVSVCVCFESIFLCLRWFSDVIADFFFAGLNEGMGVRLSNAFVGIYVYEILVILYESYMCKITHTLHRKITPDSSLKAHRYRQQKLSNACN